MKYPPRFFNTFLMSFLMVSTILVQLNQAKAAQAIDLCPEGWTLVYETEVHPIHPPIQTREIVDRTIVSDMHGECIEEVFIIEICSVTLGRCSKTIAHCESPRTGKVYIFPGQLECEGPPYFHDCYEYTESHRCRSIPVEWDNLILPY